MNAQNPHRYWYCPICFYIMTEEQSKEYRGCISPKTDILQVHLAQHKQLDLPSLLKAAGRDADTEISEAHDLLCSVCEIARRKGDNTNWTRFLARVEKYLATQNIRGVSAKTFRLLEGEEEQSKQRKALMDENNGLKHETEMWEQSLAPFTAYEGDEAPWQTMSSLLSSLVEHMKEQHTMLRAFRHSMDTNKPFPSSAKLDELINKMPI